MGKKEIFGWSMYDFANTIFSALFVTIYFPVLVVLKGGTAFHVGLIISVSLLFAGLFVPFIGAIVDLTNQKKKFLFVFTVLCCIFTFLTGLFGLIFVLIFGLLANFFYHVCLDVYDSILVNISTPKNIGWVSGIGTAVGYGGTILSVFVAYLIGRRYGHESIQGIIAIFLATALLFFLFALPIFKYTPKLRTKNITSRKMGEALRNVIRTIRMVKKYKSVWLFLLASFLYADGANTAIIFLYLYARDQLGMAVVQFLPIYVLMAIAAGLGALVFGRISDKLGPKPTLFGVLILWVVVILMMYLKTTYAIFITVGIAGGALLGAIWTITRPMLVSLAPKKKIAELFGYQGLTEKFSGVIGPFFFGLIAVKFGFRPALLVVIVLFLLGALALSGVRKR